MLNDPTFWVAIAFVVFVIAVYRPIKKSMTGALDQRAEAIRQELDTAQALREEAQKTLAEYKRLQRDAVNEAAEILESAKHEAAALREQAEHNLEEQLKRREQLALEKIEQAEATALKQIRDQAVDIAMSATRRLLVEQVDEAKSGELVDQAIKDLPNRLSN
jgi:F-type H+-transporting ATPase subunit b